MRQNHLHVVVALAASTMASASVLREPSSLVRERGLPSWPRYRGGADIDLDLEEEDTIDEPASLEEEAPATVKAGGAAAEAGDVPDIPAARALTRDEIIEKLNAIPTFCILNGDEGVVAMKLADDAKPSVMWFLDPEEAQAVLGAAVKDKPDAGLRLGCHGLGAVFEQCNGWGDADAGATATAASGDQIQLKLMGPYGIVKEVAPKLQELMRNQGMDPGDWQCPVFMCDQLQSRRIVPVFFNPADLAKTWATAGRKAEELPENLTVMDVRMLVQNMLTDSSPWELIQFVGSQEAVKLAQDVAAKQAGQGA